MPTSGVPEKARGKVALEPGHSLMAWMRLSTGGTVDLTGGVGAVDEDEDEESWKEWTLTEVKKHNTEEDLWMALHGRVYNVTPYLRYHPGGVETLVEAAGTDATDLFDEHHKWVNARGIMEACCIGRLHSGCATSSINRIQAVDVSDPADEVLEAGRHRTIKWDEHGIEAHDAERGVLFGASRIAWVDLEFVVCGTFQALSPFAWPTSLAHFVRHDEGRSHRDAVPVPRRRRTRR